MPDAAQITRSIGSIRTELEFLQANGVLSPPQFQSIMAQLPSPTGSSAYVDQKYSNGPPPQLNPSLVAQQAQDPNNPAHPNNPHHGEWAMRLAQKFGNAAVMGAGATFGADMVNDAIKKF